MLKNGGGYLYDQGHTDIPLHFSTYSNYSKIKKIKEGIGDFFRG